MITSCYGYCGLRAASWNCLWCDRASLQFVIALICGKVLSCCGCCGSFAASHGGLCMASQSGLQCFLVVLWVGMRVCFCMPTGNWCALVLRVDVGLVLHANWQLNCFSSFFSRNPKRAQNDMRRTPPQLWVSLDIPRTQDHSHLRAVHHCRAVRHLAA